MGATEESDRFFIFKKNLATIDALNRQNPLAKFGITIAADLTEDERKMQKMSPKYSDYQSMLDSLDQDMVKAAKKGPAEVMGKTFKSVQKSEHSMDQGQVEWADDTMCAACTRMPGLKNYDLNNMPTDFDWRDNGAV